MSTRASLRVDDRFLGGLILLGEIPQGLRPRVVPAVFEHARRPLARALVSLAERFPRFTPDMVAEELARNGAGVAGTLKIHDLLGGGALPDELEDLLRLLEERLARGDGHGAAGQQAGWEILDAAEHEAWTVVRPPWLVHPIIAAGTIGYVAGLPKVGKSLAVLDLLLHETHGRDWLGRFTVAKPGPTVLYVAREDPAWRLRERIAEMQAAYGFPPIPPGRFLILSRERLTLTEKAHLEWLRRTVKERGVGLLVLDVLGRMLRGLRPMDEGDWAKAQDILEELNRDMGLTIALLDHSRKPPLGSGKAGGASPVDLKGPVERYGGADWMVVLAEDEHPGRVEVYAESKDSDQRPHFIIEVAPIGAGGPKLTWVCDVQRLAKGSREVGEANREALLAVFEPGKWLSPADVGKRVKETGRPMAERTVRKHLRAMVEGQPPRLVVAGSGKNTRYTMATGSGTDAGTAADAGMQEGDDELPF